MFKSATYTRSSASHPGVMPCEGPRRCSGKWPSGFENRGKTAVRLWELPALRPHPSSLLMEIECGKSHMMTDFCLFAVLLTIVCVVWQWWRGANRNRWWWMTWLFPGVALATAIWLASGDIACQKVLARLALPVGLLWMGMMALAFLLWLRRQIVPAVCMTVLIAFLSVFGGAWCSGRLIQYLEDQVPGVAPEKAPLMPAVFVLGGGSGSRGGRGYLNEAGDRLVAAMACWTQGRTGLIVASGCNVVGTVHHGRDSRDVWIRLGVAESAIRIIPFGRVTSEEVSLYAAMARAEGWQRPGLVTSAWHMPRALRLCKREGLEVVPLLADQRGGRPAWVLSMIVPDETSLRRSAIALWELGGMMVGR